MHVVVRTPDAEVIATEAVSVSLVTELGAMQIFPGHASLQGTILLSPLRIETSKQEEDFVVQRGFVMVDQQKDEVMIMAYTCEKREEINLQTAKEYLQVLVDALHAHESLGKYQLLHLESEKIATEKRLEILNT
ncbi:hypothetical protein KBD61_00555 [Patescibacteria group bacterium]|nr:hypothetical protein [Patescibacteria group bacterium]MBP9709497.1 hypothetical protein [Patescibacteria group bacterium]